jgi:hypothetical protein
LAAYGVVVYLLSHDSVVHSDAGQIAPFVLASIALGFVAGSWGSLAGAALWLVLPFIASGGSDPAVENDLNGFAFGVVFAVIALVLIALGQGLRRLPTQLRGRRALS